jgi:hypothetical protein
MLCSLRDRSWYGTNVTELALLLFDQLVKNCKRAGIAAADDPYFSVVR